MPYIKLFVSAINKRGESGAARLGFATLNEKGYLVPESIPFTDGFFYKKSEPKNSEWNFTSAGLKADVPAGEIIKMTGDVFVKVTDHGIEIIPQEEALIGVQEITGQKVEATEIGASKVAKRK